MNTSYTINLYKGKGDALERGYYLSIKLLGKVMKVLEGIAEKLVRRMAPSTECNLVSC